MKSTFRLFLPLVGAVTLAGSAAQAQGVESVGDCYMSLEAYDQEIEQGGYPDAAVKPLRKILGKIATACEAGKFPKADRLFKAADAEYETLLAGDGEAMSGLAASEGDFWSTARVWWGQTFAPDRVRLMRADVNGDGLPDLVGYKVNLDSPEGIFLNLLEVVKRADGSVKFGAHSFPYGGTDQDGLCHMEEQYPLPDVTVVEWDPAEIGDAVVPRSIAIDDGMCDRIYVFWPSQTGAEEEVQLRLFRN